MGAVEWDPAQSVETAVQARRKMRTLTQGVVLGVSKEAPEHATLCPTCDSHVQCSPDTFDGLYTPCALSLRGTTPSLVSSNNEVTEGEDKATLPIHNLTRTYTFEGVAQSDPQWKDTDAPSLSNPRSEVPVKMLQSDPQRKDKTTPPFDSPRRSEVSRELLQGDSQRKDKDAPPLGKHRKGEVPVDLLQGDPCAQTDSQHGTHQDACCTCLEGATVRQVSLLLFICTAFFLITYMFLSSYCQP